MLSRERTSDGVIERGQVSGETWSISTSGIEKAGCYRVFIVQKQDAPATVVTITAKVVED